MFNIFVVKRGCDILNRTNSTIENIAFQGNQFRN